MTPKEINVAIAIDQGWIKMPDGPDWIPPGSFASQLQIPDYAGSYNAIVPLYLALPKGPDRRRVLNAIRSIRNAVDSEYLTDIDLVLSTPLELASAYVIGKINTKV